MSISYAKKSGGPKNSGSPHRGTSRRAFLGTAAAAVAVGAVATSVPHAFSQARSVEPLRTIGLGVSIINDIQGRASKDLGFEVRGQAMDYGALFAKMRTQNDQYEIAEGYFEGMDVMWPAGVWQPIDTERITHFDKISTLVKTGKLTPESREGQGDAPFRHFWLDKDNKRTLQGPTRYVTMVPGWHNADSLGYNPKATGRAIDSWAELFTPQFKGKVALVSIPQVGAMDAAMAMEAMGRTTFTDKGNMTRQEIDVLVEFLIQKKQEGHFRALWEDFGQSVQLMTSGEVALQSMWSPAVTAVKAAGVPCIYAFPKEGMRGWHGGWALSAKLQGKQLDQAYAYINWWLEGWAGAFVARQGYYMSAYEPVKKHLALEEWDYWYEGKLAAKALSDPLGTVIVPKDEVRDGGSYWKRFSNIAVWNSIMDENEYLVKRWTAFLSA